MIFTTLGELNTLPFFTQIGYKNRYYLFEKNSYKCYY